MVDEVQRAQRTVYEGAPVCAWRAGLGKSLPPEPPDPAHPKVRPRTTMPPALLAEVRRRIGQGERCRDIATSLGIDVQRLYAVQNRMRKDTLIGNTPVMCLLDSVGEYRWYANRIACSERTVRVMLAAMA